MSCPSNKQHHDIHQQLNATVLILLTTLLPASMD